MRSGLGVGLRLEGWADLGGEGQTEGTPKREGGRGGVGKARTNARHGAEEDKRDTKREWEK